ncbi:glycosylated lysosomal membrane protein A-like [Styela clava]
MVLFNSTNAFSILIFVLTILSEDGILAKKADFKRKVELFYNPGCNIIECNSTTTDSTVNLIYARAQGENDSLHYILSTVGPSPPSILLLRSNDESAILSVNWTKFLLPNLEDTFGSVKLVSENLTEEVDVDVENVIIFDRLLEYNDSTDEAVFNASWQFTPILLSDMVWDVNITESLPATLKGTTLKYPKSFSMNSSLSINFFPFKSNGQSDILPSLPHNANSSEWEVILESLMSRGNGSRFGVRMLVLTSNRNISKSKIKTIDDEYCPSIFTTEKIEWFNQTGAETETFTQWRTVSYTTMEHQRKYSTDVMTGSLQEVNTSSSEYNEGVIYNRLLRAYFGSTQIKSMLVQSADVFFGEPDDGFYVRTRYLSWTSAIGFGKPPVDVFSTLVICILFAGVGCPLLVIIAGGLYVAYVKIKRSNRFSYKYQLVTNYDYQPIS